MLDAWKAIADPAQRVVACFGDSTGEGVAGIANGGYVQVLRDLMRSRWGMGGLGFNGCWRDEWAFTAGGDAWTASAGGDAWAVGPYQGVWVTAQTMLGNTATKIATYTKPAAQLPITSFDIWVVDGPSAGNFSYSIDGGAWTNVSHTWNSDNSLDKITIGSSVTTSIRVRGANAAGTATNVYLTGIEPKSAGTGVVVHNMAANFESSPAIIRSNPGWGSWIDQVQPDVALIMYTNDLLTWNKAAYKTRIQEFIDRVEANGGEAIVMTMCGQSDRDGAEVQEQQAAHDELAADNNIYHINFYEIMGNYVTSNAAGYMVDIAHPSVKGTKVMAHHIWAHLGRTDQGTRHKIPS